MRFSIKVKIRGLLRFLSLMRIGKIFEVLKKILKSIIIHFVPSCNSNVITQSYYSIQKI